jgi:hypothetical protein
MENAVTEYFVIRSNKLDDLVKYVNKSLTEGWQPFGGICADGNRRTVSLYYQVVVKYGLPKNDETSQNE